MRESADHNKDKFTLGIYDDIPDYVRICPQREMRTATHVDRTWRDPLMRKKPETTEKNYLKKKVLLIEDGKIVHEYPSIKDAAQDCNRSKATIMDRVKNKKIINGQMWIKEETFKAEMAGVQ